MLKKTSIILIILALIASGCGTSKQIKTTKTSQSYRITNADVEKHCKKFIECIMSGKLKKSLAYFAPEYVKKQHDGFLNGRTNQFLREFLAGMSITENMYIVPENLTDIEVIKIKETRITPDINEANAIFEIKLITGKTYSVEVLLLIERANKLYFWGAMG